LRAEYQINAHWLAALNVNNIFDRTYYQTVGSVFNYNYYREPRNFMLSVHASIETADPCRPPHPAAHAPFSRREKGTLMKRSELSRRWVVCRPQVGQLRAGAATAYVCDTFKFDRNFVQFHIGSTGKVAQMCRCRWNRR
jgi:hypothetical protein